MSTRRGELEEEDVLEVLSSATLKQRQRRTIMRKYEAGQLTVDELQKIMKETSTSHAHSLALPYAATHAPAHTPTLMTTFLSIRSEETSFFFLGCLMPPSARRCARSVRIASRLHAFKSDSVVRCMCVVRGR
jgi:hypothetical protein